MRHSHDGLFVSVNGPVVGAKANWDEGVYASSLNPGSPWENGYIESFNGKLRDERLSREISTTLTEAKVLIEQWRREYNRVRPHSSLGYRPSAPEVEIPVTLTLGVVSFEGAGQANRTYKETDIPIFE